MEESPATVYLASLRKVALKLDRNARELRSELEENRGPHGARQRRIDEPKALQKLNGLLEETRRLKHDAEEFAAVPDDTYRRLDVNGCSKVCEQRSKDIEKLQEQLEKYGFRRREAVGETVSVSSSPESQIDQGEEKKDGQQHTATPTLLDVGLSRQTLNRLREMKKQPESVQVQNSKPSPSVEATPENQSLVHSPAFPGIQSVEVKWTCLTPRVKDGIAKTLEFTDSPLLTNAGDGTVQNVTLSTLEMDNQTWTVAVPSSAPRKRMSQPDISLHEATSLLADTRRNSEQSVNYSGKQNDQTKGCLPQTGVTVSQLTMSAGSTPLPPKPVTAHLHTQNNKEGRDHVSSPAYGGDTSIVSNSLASLAALAAELETSSSRQQQRRRKGQIERISSSPSNLGGDSLKRALLQMHSPQSDSPHSPASPKHTVSQSNGFPESPVLSKPVAFVSGQTKGTVSGRDSPSYFEQLGKARLQADLTTFQTSLNLSLEQHESDKQIAQVSEDEYQSSAAYLRSHVPLSYLNDIISKINAHTTTERAEVGMGHLLMSELRDELGLGSKATGIQLLLIKLKRIKRYGNSASDQVVYSIC